MPRQQTELVVWSWAHWVTSGCCRWGGGFCFSGDPGQTMERVSCVQRADARQWQCCLHDAYISAFSVSATPFLPLATLSLSLSLSSSGLIRAGLWREGEMVTVTTAENDGQSGRALFVHVCVWLHEAIQQYSLSNVYCAVYCLSLKVGILCSFSMHNKVSEVAAAH